MDGITYSLLIHAAAITHPSSFSVSAHGASLSASSEADKQHRFMFAEDLVDEYYTEAGSMGLKLTADAYVVVVEQACVAHRAYLDAQEIAGRLKVCVCGKGGEGRWRLGVGGWKWVLITPLYFSL